MERMKLSAKELVLAASTLGAKTFYGLPDPFFGMDPLETAREVTELQLSLEKKGYARMGFDDSFALTAQARQLVAVCAGCERYLIASLLPPGQAETSIVFYQMGEETAELAIQGEMLFLAPIGREQIPNKLWEELTPPNASETLPISEGEVSHAALAKARQCTEYGATLAALVDGGCPESLAIPLTEGLQNKAGFCTLALIDLKGHTLEQLLFISGERGCLRLSPVVTESEDRWDLHAVEQGQIRRWIDRLCSAFAPPKGGVAR